MKNILMLAIIAFVIGVSTYAVNAYAEAGDLRGSHSEAELSCADCHGVDDPVKRAKTSSCMTCHEDHEGEVRTYYNNGSPVEVNVHESHQGKLRCTLCHYIHEESKLYCNQDGCHAFDNNMNVK